MDNLEINLKLTVAQVNAVLAHLSKGAYADVVDLITNIREQAVPQVSNAVEKPKAQVPQDEEPQA